MAVRRTTQSVEPTRKEIVIKDRIVNVSKTSYRRTTSFIHRKPLTAFLAALGILLLLLIVGRLFQQAPAEKTAQKQTKDIKVYSIGRGPQATFQAKVEKSGVIQIVAQAPGIVSNIPVEEGQTVSKGQTIISLSNNYQGGNASSVQRQIAQRQYQGALDTYGPQVDLINKQRDVATASAQNAQQTRDIAQQSVGETNDLINANQTQLDQMKQQLTVLQALPPSKETNAAIAELQAGILQAQGGINQLKQAQRTTEFQASNDKSPALLSNLQKDVTLKQLEVQEKTLQLNKDVSKLQVNLAYVNESLMYPTSPFSGTVEKISVKEGQSVSAGTVLATITSDTVESSAVLLVPQNVAELVGLGEPSYLMIDGKQVAATPYYVSSQATDGQLFSVFYDIPDDVQNKVSNGDYISINVPLGTANTTSAAPLIPIDAVYQNQDSAYVLVSNNNKAESRTIAPGDVYGNYVSIEKGLKDGDQIILNRNVIAGDAVAIK
jgi:RND family efflux transporter MFP subunit